MCASEIPSSTAAYFVCEDPERSGLEAMCHLRGSFARDFSQELRGSAFGPGAFWELWCGSTTIQRLTEVRKGIPVKRQGLAHLLAFCNLAPPEICISNDDDRVQGMKKA